MTVEKKLNLNLRSYWRPGTGRGSGSHVDEVADKDRFGCPFVGGKMLKGLMRDAVYRLQHWNSMGLGTAPNEIEVLEILFGSWAYEDMHPRSETRPGLIRVSNATIDDATRQWLTENTEYRQALYHDIYRTAIDRERGVAKQGSLRGEQVAVPMDLTARLLIMHPDELPTVFEGSDSETWVYKNAGEIIKSALPLIASIGAGRSRGLGRVVMSLEDVV